MKIKSPNLNMIAHLNTDLLYAKAIVDNVPFFEWYAWIESTIQKEVFSQLRRSKKGAKDGTKDGPKDATKDKKDAKRK